MGSADHQPPPWPPPARELPMEYAVELNQLMRMEMEGSVG